MPRSLEQELSLTNDNINSCVAYRGDDEFWALLGWADWMIERQIIKKEIRNAS